MTREKINEMCVMEQPYWFANEREETWYKTGCIDGLYAADEEPNLESIWHNVSEKPKYGEWFLAQIGDDAFDTFVMTMEKNQDWKEWSNGINIKRWVYIEDLLPKEYKK